MNVSFLDNETIWRTADDFRLSKDLAGHDLPPIDVFYIADVILRFDVIDIPDLQADLRMDAAIVPGQKTVYVDRDAIQGWERQDRWIEKRLRFSVAHELGHFLLHREYQEDIRFAHFDEFKRWILEHRRNNRLEDQADEFAGRFLVPPDILREEYDRFQKKMAAADPSWYDVEGMRSHVAKKIASRFGVNHQVIETRFAREGLWPLE
ncbi:MAG: ImmA/IrrE family metallo-endopeptidase [Lentisphaerae bacterium]|nr:ImmA/IrrE family metallo-endopeptidase [Lentisphaerota bacterium]